MNMTLFDPSCEGSLFSLCQSKGRKAPQQVRLQVGAHRLQRLSILTAVATGVECHSTTKSVHHWPQSKNVGWSFFKAPSSVASAATWGRAMSRTVRPKRSSVLIPPPLGSPPPPVLFSERPDGRVKMPVQTTGLLFQVQLFPQLVLAEIGTSQSLVCRKRGFLKVSFPDERRLGFS